jgi:hypothetical protein
MSPAGLDIACRLTRVNAFIECKVNAEFGGQVGIFVM